MQCSGSKFPLFAAEVAEKVASTMETAIETAAEAASQTGKQLEKAVGSVAEEVWFQLKLCVGRCISKRGWMVLGPWRKRHG